MDVSRDITAKPVDERSWVLRKQKETSLYLRQLIEQGEDIQQVHLPEETNWKVQEQDEEEDLPHSGLESDPALTSYR